MAKIVYVVGGLSRIDGMSQVLSQKINYLAENTDYDIHVVLTENTGKPFCYKMSPKIHLINFDINFDELDTMPIYKKIVHYAVKQRKYKKAFYRFLMELRPDITVSTMRREINFINSIPDGSRKIGEIHFNKSNYRQFNAPFLPKVVCRHISNSWMKKLMKEINKLDRFIVLTHEDKREWHGINNIEVIPNPIARYPSQDYVSDTSSKNVIAAGRYTWQKGFDLLIEAWTHVAHTHTDWTLNIYGNGNNKPFQKLAKEKGVAEYVVCNAAVQNIYEKYKESSIFILSSRYEGFGLVLTEAMSCGLPAVSFTCPCGPRDIITDNVDGFLVEKENPKALAEKINLLIENAELRKDMGSKARQNTVRFKEEPIMRKWIALFDSLIQKQ